MKNPIAIPKHNTPFCARAEQQLNRLHRSKELSLGFSRSYLHALSMVQIYLQNEKENVPIERPFQQELPGCLGEAGTALVMLQDLSDNVIQPTGPLVQRALLLQGELEILLQLLHHALLALAHP